MIRPPVAMPLAEMMMAGVLTLLIRLDSSAVLMMCTVWASRGLPLALLGEVLGVVVFAMAHVELGNTDGHGAVDVYREAGDALGVFELADVVHQHLGAVHGEGPG